MSSPALLSVGGTGSSVPAAPPSQVSEVAALVAKAAKLYASALQARASVNASEAPTADQLRHLQTVVASSPTAEVGVAMLDRALHIFQRVYGKDHPSVASVSKVLGCLHAHCGNKVEALKHFKVAVTLCERHFGTDALITMDVVYNVGVLASLSGDHATAVRSLSRVEGVYARHHGEVHPLTVRVREKLAASKRLGMSAQYTTLFSTGLKLRMDGAHREAEAAFRGCLELVADDPQVAYHVAACACRQGNADAGMEWFRRAVQWGYDDIDTARDDTDLAPLREAEQFWELLTVAADSSESGGDDSGDDDDDGGADDIDM